MNWIDLSVYTNIGEAQKNSHYINNTPASFVLSDDRTDANKAQHLSRYYLPQAFWDSNERVIKTGTVSDVSSNDDAHATSADFDSTGPAFGQNYPLNVLNQTGMTNNSETSEIPLVNTAGNKYVEMIEDRRERYHIQSNNTQQYIAAGPQPYWCDSVGQHLVHELRLQVGSQIVDTVYSHYLDALLTPYIVLFNRS